MEDKKIVEMYLSRNEAAIKHTSEKYGTRLRNISLGITKDRQACEECENDTYLAAWNSIPPNEPVNYFYAFLARIIRHISIDRCRKNASLKRNVYLTDLSDELELCLPSEENIEDNLSAKELGNAINAFLGTLPEEKRIMFIRRYFYLDEINDISSRLSISKSKVKTTLFRIRNDLREFLIKGDYI